MHYSGSSFRVGLEFANSATHNEDGSSSSSGAHQRSGAIESCFMRVMFAKLFSEAARGTIRRMSYSHHACDEILA